MTRRVFVIGGKDGPLVDVLSDQVVAFAKESTALAAAKAFVNVTSKQKLSIVEYIPKPARKKAKK